MSHLMHVRSSLLRPTPQRRSVPLGRNPRRALRESRRARGRVGPRRRRERRPHKETERTTARPGNRRVGAAHADDASARLPVCGSPALALTAAEELETIRTVLLEAATSTTRESWATCTCPECGKGFRQEISVPDHGARIKAIETLLREGLGRVGEADVVQPRMPTTVQEVGRMSWSELKLVFALWHAKEIKAVVGRGEGALWDEVAKWEPSTRTAVAEALAAVA